MDLTAGGVLSNQRGGLGCLVEVALSQPRLTDSWASSSDTSPEGLVTYILCIDATYLIGMYVGTDRTVQISSRHVCKTRTTWTRGGGVG